jgi:hemerythrin
LEDPAIVMIRWKDSYSVGHPVLDEQHKRICDLLNQLEAAEAKDSTLVFQTIKGLQEYSRTHFATEVAFMHSIHFHGIEAHQEKHAFFMDELEKLDRAANTHNGELYGETLEFLMEWIIDHVLIEDQKYNLKDKK